MAEPFTPDELESLRERAMALASEDQDAGLRAALQLLGEAAANLIPKVAAEERN